MFVRIALAFTLASAPAASAAPPASYEELIAQGTREQEANNPIEASDVFRRAFEAMPADIKRQDIGEELAATLHYEARYTAWRYTGEVQHLEQAQRVLEVLLAEQFAAWA